MGLNDLPADYQTQTCAFALSGKIGLKKKFALLPG